MEGILSNEFSKRASSFTVEMFSLEGKAETLFSINQRPGLVANRRSDELLGPHGTNRVIMKEITMVLLRKCVTSHYNLKSSKAAPSPSSSSHLLFVVE